MGHLFILCGPPGCGKTTLLKMIDERNLQLTQMQRITTRQQRSEENDEGTRNLEYEFLDRNEFSGRLSTRNIATFVEWGGNFYATDMDDVLKWMESGKDCLLYEDIPSAVHLKKNLGPKATVILLFTDDRSDIEKLDFTGLLNSQRPSILEWKRRLELKFQAMCHATPSPKSSQSQEDYVNRKMERARPDLAFIAGRIKNGDDLQVLANRKDESQQTLDAFLAIVENVKSELSNCVFVLMPFKAELDLVYDRVVKPAVHKHGLTCERGDEVNRRREVVQDVKDHIRSAALIIADITGGNANVFWELGIAMTEDKPIVLLTQDCDEDVPFNVKTMRQIRYTNSIEGWEHLFKQLSTVVARVKRGDPVGE